MLSTVLRRRELTERPPVLVDIGASGGVPELWKPISAYCHCLAFDADKRDVGILETQDSGFRSLKVVPRVVTAGDETTLPFFLTESPHCSSSLTPQTERLRSYSFAPAFNVVKKVDVPAISLSAALTQAGFGHVDWLKVDAQGVDLRLFASLPRPIADAILAVDFEPGIIDAYCGEDKLHDVLRCLEARPFWCSGLEVRGDWRIDAGLLDRSFSPFERRLIRRTHPVAPGWAQLQFMNTFQAPGPVGLREMLLGWVFATLVGQHLFAFELANKGWDRFQDPMFPELAQDSKARLRRVFPRALVAIALRRIWRLASMFRRARP